MPCTTAVSVVRTIGIDTGKNTLHMIGLNEKGAIVLREKVSTELPLWVNRYPIDPLSARQLDAECLCRPS